MRRHLTPIVVAAVAALSLLLSLNTAGFAGEPQGPDTPYQPTQALKSDFTKNARIVMPARRHPNVAVSRSLAAQPVHPWKVQVVLRNSMSTYIDPLNPLAKGDGLHLDENHSLVKAQRRHQQLTGLTTSQLHQLRNEAAAAGSHLSRGNRAQAYHPNRAPSAQPQRAEAHRPNTARVIRPNRGRAQQPAQSQRIRIHVVPKSPEPEKQPAAPAAEPEPAPRQEQKQEQEKNDRRSVPIPHVPRHEEPMDDRMAHGDGR